LLLLRGKEHQRSKGGMRGVVSTKFLTSAHTLSYDLLNGFVPFVEKQCVEYNASGNLVYDFKNAEQYLLDVYFTGKPLIDIEMRMFQFANEVGTFNTTLLKQKVAQEPLPGDIATAILKDLGSPAAARKALELLETCVSFLQATGGTTVRELKVGNQKLGEYAQTTLMMKEAEFGSKVVSSRVLLKHVDALWRLLRDFTVVNPFANVRPRYKAKLDEKLKAELLDVSHKFDLPILLPAMKDCMMSQLSEDTLGAEMMLKETLDYWFQQLDDQGNLDWLQLFPEEIQNQHFLETYYLLEASGE